MIRLFLLVCLLAHPAYAKDLAQEIYKEVLCAVCNGQSIAESDVELAKSMRLIIKQKLAEGYSKEQVEQYLTNRYGEQIITNPPFNMQTYFLWLAPIIAIIISIFILRAKIKWRT